MVIENGRFSFAELTSAKLRIFVPDGARALTPPGEAQYVAVPYFLPHVGAKGVTKHRPNKRVCPTNKILDAQRDAACLTLGEAKPL